MPGEMEIVFSLAGRMHVLLRREINRIIDVEWMCIDAGYAKEVIKLARSAEADELQVLADRIEAVHPLLPRIEYPEQRLPVVTESKYVKTLR
jgi:hypothetical protein